MREINYVKIKYGPFYENGWLIANFVRLWVGIKRPVLPVLLPRRPACLPSQTPACCEVLGAPSRLAAHSTPYPRKVTVFWANGLPNAAALTELQGLQLPSFC